MERRISPDAWTTLARALLVEEAALRAVAEVESRAQPFLPAPDDRPIVLFEGHAFHRLTGGRYDADHPTLSFARWTRRHYARTRAGEWARLDAAAALDRPAALQSAAWGAFQIMGFNYALCGFGDVEAFVAAQKSGAPAQLETFARFVARDTFLRALRQRNWAAFARHYNGPRYRENQHDTRLRDAYARLGGGAATAARRRLPAPAARGVQASARPAFAPAPAGRRPAFRRTVQADAVDLRDWAYRPGVAEAPSPWRLPHNPRVTANQRQTSACTGFALATVIEYLLDRARRPVERISGHMLYSMARRYDEWAGNDDTDEGSSLRGALKGWSRHGASALRLWRTAKTPAATNNGDTDWWLDAVRRPLGAYYRVQPGLEADMHCALTDAGVLYASAFTHAGWDALHRDAPQEPPVDPADLPVIECHDGDPDGGHAFAVVGYTDKGFVVQNSWGAAWGRGGFAVLTYSDWRRNAMDCWVVQLGVVTEEHQAVSRAGTLRLEDCAPEAAGPARGPARVVVSSEPDLANHEIGPFIVNVGNEGRLSPRGRFRTTDEDLQQLAGYHLDRAIERWAISTSGTVDVVLYAHGGLVGEEAAAAIARAWVPLLYSNRLFPVFLMWETDGLSTVFNIVRDAVEGEEGRLGADWIERFRRSLTAWKNERIEGLTRLPGGELWREMKDNAEDLASARGSGVVRLLDLLRARARRATSPAVRLHLVGHSAGAIAHTHLARRALAMGFAVGSLGLLAPAVRVDDFARVLGGAITSTRLPVLVAHLTESAELADPTCRPYGHSLLHLVSRAFERAVDVPLLGLERHLVPAVAAYDWGRYVTRMASPGGVPPGNDLPLTTTTHGGFDEDRAVQAAMVRMVRGAAHRVVWPSITA